MNKDEQLRWLDEEILRQRLWVGTEEPNPRVSSGLTADEWRGVFADAKAVRETALRNAKEALRRAFESNGCIVETD